jgi:hypothetical protein
MIKLISLTKRKSDLTFEEFRDYYESTHAKVGERFLPPYCVKYMRRYVVDSIAHHTGTEAAPPVDHDCIVEMWFPDEEALAAFRRSIATPEAQASILHDEDMFVDRSATRRYRVEEHVSWDTTG